MAECLDSVIGQTFSDIEIICINDGSLDGPLKILQKYAEKDNMIIIDQENNGVSAARSAGIKIAKAKYIAFVDTDDYVAPNAYEVALKYIEKADLVWFEPQLFSEDWGDISNQEIEANLVKYTGLQKLDDEKRKNINITVWSKIFKKEIIDQHNVTFQTGLLHEDHGFYWKYIIHADTVFCLQEKLYFYRKRKGSITGQISDGRPFAVDHLNVIDDVFNYWSKINKFNSILAQSIFEKYFWMAFENVTKSYKPKVLALGTKLANKWFADGVGTIRFLQNGDYKRMHLYEHSVPCRKLSRFLEKIFAVKNIYNAIDGCKWKCIVFFGMKLKLKKLA